MTTTLERRRLSSRSQHPSRLTDVEVRVLAEIAGGSTLDLTARRLDVSTRTIRRRVRDACDRLGVDTPIEAIVWAVKHDLI